MFCIFFSVQNPDSFWVTWAKLSMNCESKIRRQNYSVGHTFNELSVENQKQNYSVLDCENLLSLSILFLTEETIFFFKNNSGDLTGGKVPKF
jgi:hypothetical protein